MASYPCSNCGATADTATGCPSCGQTLDEEIASRDRDIAAMQRHAQTLTEGRTLAMARLEGALTVRNVLLRSRPTGSPPAPTRTVPRARKGTGPITPPPDQPIRTTTAPGKPGRPSPRRPPIVQEVPLVDAAGHPVETSPRSRQNIVLGTGAAVMALAIILLSLLYGSLGGLRVVILLVLTVAFILVPIRLARSGLESTSEWISPIGLLLILVDGEELWSPIMRGTHIRPTTYAGLVVVVAAIVATLYQRATGLAVPRFATVVLLQPIPVLLLYPAMHGTSAWAAVMTLVAAADILLARRTKPSRVHGDYLRPAIRALQQLVTLGALVVGTVATLTVHGTWPEVRAGTTVVTAALVALAGGLLFTEPPVLPHIGTGIAVLAAIAGFGRLGSLAVPGSGLAASALATVACALGVRALPAYARLGGEIAGGVAAVGTAVAIVVHGWSLLAAPIRGGMPAWRADLSTYSDVVTHASVSGGAVLVPAALLLGVAGWLLAPEEWRRTTAMAGAALAAVLLPGAWHAEWGAAVFSGTVITLLLGAVALDAPTTIPTHDGVAKDWIAASEGWLRLVAPFAVGGYTMGIAVARPSGQALYLGVLTLGAAGIAAWPSLVRQSDPLAADRRVVEAAWGTAAFAMPGALAAACAVPTIDGAIVGEAVISAAFIAVAATLTAAAIAQVAVRRPMPLLVGGAAAGALVTAIAAINTAAIETTDRWVAVVLLIGALLLLAGPVLSTGFRPLGLAGLKVENLDGEEVAAAAVTFAAIVALTRVGMLILPNEMLALVAVLVLVVAVLIRTLRERWRRGPAVGGGLVGVGVTVAAGYAAIDVGLTAIGRTLPPWHATLTGWATAVDQRTIEISHGAQAPLSLVFMAIAARVALGRRAASVAIAITGGLLALILPETLHTGSPGPLIFSGITATALGLLGGASTDPVVAYARTGMATLLFADTIAASLVAPGITAGTLALAAMICAGIAVIAVRTRAAMEGSEPLPAHPIIIGGSTLAAAVLGVPAATACAAATIGANKDAILSSAMGGLAVALVAVAVAARRLRPLLAYASGAVSLGGLGIALAAADDFTTTGVFSSVAALLAVLAEVLRSRIQDSRPARVEVLLAAGPATALAIGSVAATIFAALIGPYRFVGRRTWQGPPATFDDELGSLAHIVGHPTGIATSFVLVVAAVAASIGFGGSRQAITERAVAIIVPGVSIGLLIAPYLARAPWPFGSITALAVASICGLSVALTEEPAHLVDGSPLRAARNVVIGICALALCAGMAGALATQPMTEVALAVTTAVGVVAAIGGREQPARITGWIVASIAAQLLALASTLIGGARAYDAAFVVGGIAAALLIVAARLPLLRRPENIVENVTVEVSAYAGAVLALVLAARSIPHLAVFLAAWGAVLSIATARPERPPFYRSTLMWTAAAHELVAWFLLMNFNRVAVPEAYTLGVAVISLITGWIERRWHPELTSWVTYGIALSAAFGPSVIILVTSGENVMRIVYVLVGSAAVLIWGAVRSQQAPTVIGGVALLVSAVDLVVRNFSTILVLILLAVIAAVLIGLGATFEKQRNNIQRALSALNKMQ